MIHIFRLTFWKWLLAFIIKKLTFDQGKIEEKGDYGLCIEKAVTDQQNFGYSAKQQSRFPSEGYNVDVKNWKWLLAFTISELTDDRGENEEFGADSVSIESAVSDAKKFRDATKLHSPFTR